MRVDDTIFAVSSGRPPAAVAIIRISGPSAMAAGRRLAGTLPPFRRAALRRLRDAAGVTLDHALVLAFDGPATATGEDLVELHCHGGRAVVNAVEAALGGIAGLRAADPGEFTRRALRNGRIDLAEAEGLADLLEAETEAQRRAALAAAEGQVSRTIDAWLRDLAVLAARTEVLLDFADEDDGSGEDVALAAIASDARRLADAIATVTDAPPVERLRDGVRVVIAGPPNSGKSTLLNLLAERDAAIVSPISGTTRDRIEASVVRSGIAYVLTDTAGLTADTDDAVERIGVGRAEEAIASADLLLWMADAAPPRTDALWIAGRADLPGRGRRMPGQDIAIAKDDPIAIARLWTLIEARATAMLPAADAVPLKRTQRRLCMAAADELRIVSRDPVLVAEHLRRARVPLATLLGYDATETMLDALFGRFCIGK